MRQKRKLSDTPVRVDFNFSSVYKTNALCKLWKSPWRKLGINDQGAYISCDIPMTLYFVVVSRCCYCLLMLSVNRGET
jgi:hypothetical protein